jgi:predicted nucleic acid-binding protein
MVLAKLNLLYLLKQLYGQVHFARSVYDETVVEGMRQGYEDARTLYLFFSQMDWHPQEIDAAEVLGDMSQMPLDRGERDTLALAVAKGNPIVLIDETEGRQAARDRGLKARGSLGALVEAYKSSAQLRRWPPIPLWCPHTMAWNTDPHHKHIPPDIKNHRLPAPELSFTRPNLPFLIQEIEQVLDRSPGSIRQAD